MPQLITEPTIISSAGNKPKIIEEVSATSTMAKPRPASPACAVPADIRPRASHPEFDEFTFVLAGRLQVKHRNGVLQVAAGQAIITHAGEWVQYSTPHPERRQVIAICMPAFSMETVHRDPE